jgi:transcriptional/translational regulatory protein YebC/TACO1
MNPMPPKVKEACLHVRGLSRLSKVPKHLKEEGIKRSEGFYEEKNVHHKKYEGHCTKP